MGWVVFLDFGDSQRSKALEWRMSSESVISYRPCRRARHEVPLEAAGRLKFCDLSDQMALFAKNQVQYVALDFTPPEFSSAASRRAWLLHQLSQLRSW